MAEPAEKIATYADLQAVPAHLVAEIINGALVTHPRPVPRHAVAGKWLLPGVAIGDQQVKLAPFEAAPFSLGVLWPFDTPVDPNAAPAG